MDLAAALLASLTLAPASGQDAAAAPLLVELHVLLDHGGGPPVEVERGVLRVRRLLAQQDEELAVEGGRARLRAIAAYLEGKGAARPECARTAICTSAQA